MRLFRVVTITALITLTLNLANDVPAHADGDDDQAPPIPEKRDLRYPNLGSHLDQLVAQVEGGEATARRRRRRNVHTPGGIGGGDHLPVGPNVDEVVKFLEDNGGDPRNVGEDYIEAYVPVSLLGPVSERTGVLRVREIVPPEPMPALAALHQPTASKRSTALGRLEPGWVHRPGCQGGRH